MTKLPQRIKLDGENEVRLTEIFHAQNFINIDNSDGKYWLGSNSDIKVFCMYEFNVPFSTTLAARWTQTRESKTANEIHCAHISYIATQKGYTYNTKLHEQCKPET